VNNSWVTRLPGLGLLMIVSTAFAAADSSAEPPGILDRIVDRVATGIEVVGIAMILVGAFIATAVFLRQLLRGGDGFTPAYRQCRGDLGQALLLGLEFLVAADIIGTVAVDPTFRSLGVLGLIVLIRTFLSFALEVEIQGRWPWQDHEQSEAAREGHASS
jgi:uncharacterized membrane protein